MAHAVTFPSRASTEYRGLSFWMQRTLDELSDFQSDPSADNVHDLRVALRRCRSIAATMEEIDPHPEWEEMRDCARKLFRALGEVRDAHVMTEWLNNLHPEADALKQHLLDSLASTERAGEGKAQQRARNFDQKRWKKLSRSLSARMRRVPVDGDAAHCLALERLEEAKELHRRAMRTENAKPWHALRIGVKRFRYTAEFLLPATYAHWDESLKRVQDVLGNIHDFDVLAAMIRKAQTEYSGETGDDWKTSLEIQRAKAMQTYRQLALGTTSVWNEWLSAFPHESRERYARARIKATRAAMDRKPARSNLIMRLAARLWTQLRARKAAEIVANPREKRVLEAAAGLGGISSPKAGNRREKSARTFLLESPVPPQWTVAEWERVAWAIRFQRGAEPNRRNKKFLELSPEQQLAISLLAGILRLAIAAQKAGVTASSSLRLENLAQGYLLHVGGVEDSPKNAARFTAAKQLLERRIGKIILVQAEPSAAASLDRKKAVEVPAPISIAR